MKRTRRRTNVSPSPRCRFSRLLCLVAVAVASAICRPAAAQWSNTVAVRNRLANAAPLIASEIADVLQASREALGYVSLRLSFKPIGSGPEVLMAPDGRPLFLRASSGSLSTWWSFPQPQVRARDGRVDAITLTHYTRHAPQYCDGSYASGELVVEYEKRGDEWTVSARQWRSTSEPFGQIFAMLSGDLSLEDVGRAVIRGRQARALRAAWSAPSAPDSETARGITPVRPNARPSAGAVQTLWLDERTFEPLRWAVTPSTPAGITAPSGLTSIESAIFFSYDNSIDLRPPAGIEPPECLDRR